MLGLSVEEEIYEWNMGLQKEARALSLAMAATGVSKGYRVDAIDHTHYQRWCLIRR